MKIIDVNEIKVSRMVHKYGNLRPQRMLALDIHALFPGRICRINGEIRWWSGRQWQVMSKNVIKKLINDAMPLEYFSKR